MVLVIILILAALAGLSYGLVKRKKAVIISSAIGLSLIAILLLIYNYFYALNPY